ncbi:PA2169 family four-helix-bundle protein [Mariniblastus fucicola]|uniref:DUF2383 domain-containing protein n=1 Tax=Mariniblastus fucicola TaxID=980251 RepID=A0A5B9PQC4_9BACT|nr:PA2169 family four-helix-bundle protein [Mariniblastus fucicola]QEG24671.1 hypothetical protein MFFC18_45920 [Mariniblastus fucicola]
MTDRVATSAQNMKQETVDSLQELMYALTDSVKYLGEASDSIEDDHVKNVFRKIADDRKNIDDTIGGFITLADERPEEEGTWLGSLRTCWTNFRAGLNSGDPTVVLIEAERAEDSLKAKFESVLPEVAGNPINDKLLGYYKTVKSGHDQILALRNAYQNA